jgi:hypothetical protein
MTDFLASARTRWKAHKRLWWFVLAMTVIITTAIVEHFGVFAYFLASVFSVTALYFAASMNWSLHTRPWLWLALSVFAVLHVPLIILIGKYVPMKGHIDGHGVVGIALADAAIMTGIIRFPDFLKESIKYFKEPNAEGTTAK